MQTQRNFFSDLETPETNRVEPISQSSEPFEPSFNTGKDFFSDTPPQKSIGQHIGESVPVQAALGAATSFTWLGDLYKGWARAEAMQGLEELEEKGIPIDKKKYMEAVESATNLVPTQKMGEDLFKKYTGINLEPEEGSAGAFARGAAEFTNPKGIVKAGLKGFAKKAASGVAGEAVKEGAEAFGIPKGISTILGSAASAGSSISKETKALTGEAKHLEEIAKKHKLRKVSGIFEENLPVVKPSASETKISGVKKELLESTKKAVDEVIEGRIPIAQAVKKGVNIPEIYTRAYDVAYHRASEATNLVDTKPIVKAINAKIRAIKKKVPSPSKADEKVLSILREERGKFSKKNKPQEGLKVTILDQYGNPIAGDKEKYTPIKMTATQAIDQRQSYNENVKGIHRKNELAGMEDAVKDTYSFLNNQIIHAMDKSGNKAVTGPLKIADNIFSQQSKLGEVYRILQPGLENPLKLKGILSSKKREFLNRKIGKQAVKELDEISLYTQKAKEKVFDQIKKKPGFMESFSQGKVLSYLVGGELGLLGLATGEGYQRLRGHLLLKDTSRKAYSDLMKAVSSGSETAIKKYSLQLDKAVEEDFGSVENFFENE